MAVIAKTFSIANISIRASADTVEKRVRSLNGIKLVAVDISSNTMLVEYDPDITDEQIIIQTVRACGYDAYTKEMPAIEDNEMPARDKLLTADLLISLGICAFCGIMTMVPSSFWICSAAAMAAVWFNRAIAMNAVNEIRTENRPGAACLRMFTYTMCLLFALFFGIRNHREGNMFLFSAATIITIASLENRIIAISRLNAAKQVAGLSSLPETASVYDDRKEKVARTEELKQDQIIIVRPGETIPADGRVVRGFAAMDESPLTGIDTPVEKSEGSYVYANSICLKGSVEIRAERTGSATAMMRLASLAEKTASDETFQSPFRNFGRYMLVYVMAAAVIAAGGWLFSGKPAVFAANVLICVLSCTALRALRLSSENEVMSAAGQAMTSHVIFRSVEALEISGKTDFAVIEQDGAVTDSELTVTDFITAEGMSEGRLEYIAYALESRSDRPFARAITRYLRSRRMAVTDIQEFTRLSRRGRNALQSLSSYRSGTWEDILARGIEPGEWENVVKDLINEGKRVLVFTQDETIIGVIAAIRPLIPGSHEAVQGLQKAGCEVWLLSDGSAEEASVLEKEIKPDHMVFRPARDERERLLADLDGEDSVTAYISMNPMETSQQDVDITVAIGTGAEPDCETAGILLTRNRLSDFLYAVQLSRRLNERIARKQMAIMIYHAAAVLLFGFVLPAVFRTPVAPAAAAVCACLCLYAVVSEKKEFR